MPQSDCVAFKGATIPTLPRSNAVTSAAYASPNSSPAGANEGSATRSALCSSLLRVATAKVLRPLHALHVLSELVDALLAKTFDVQREPRSEVANGLLALVGANQPTDATGNRLALASLDIRATGRALGWQRDRKRVSRTPV